MIKVALLPTVSRTALEIGMRVEAPPVTNP